MIQTLALNTYAGSLLLGAQQVGANVIGSYEDKGFFQPVAAANFPKIRHIGYLHQWPAQNLSDTVVVAHPPCSAFSVQNGSATARGINSNAFACTKHVLDYAMGNNALAIGVESVMGALGGAWEIHQRYADENDYHIYRVVENGCMFGAQWRERFWALWVRKGAAEPNMRITLKPRWQTAGEAVKGHEEGPVAGNLQKLYDEQRTRLQREASLTDEEMAFFFAPEHEHPTKALGTLLFEKKFKTTTSTSMDKWQVFQDYIGGFASGTMVYIDPRGLAPVLMGGSFWVMHGRPLSENAFKRIGGFPADYIFPESPKNFRKDLRTGLSKGVMPPIAAWILEVLARHLKKEEGLNLQHPDDGDSYVIEVAPNHIADFRIKKQDWWLRDQQLPPLRHDEERSGERPLPPKKFNFSEAELTPQQRSAIERAIDALQWASGSPDFNEGGQAREGWLNLGQPALDELTAALRPTSEPEHKQKPVKIARHTFEASPQEGTAACFQCGELVDHPVHRVKVVKQRVERPHRDVSIVPSRLSGIRIRTTELVPDDLDVTSRRRKVMYTIVAEMSAPTLDEAVAAVIMHPEVPILPTTARWHLRQMMKDGHLEEARTEVVA